MNAQLDKEDLSNVDRHILGKRSTSGSGSYFPDERIKYDDHEIQREGLQIGSLSFHHSFVLPFWNENFLSTYRRTVFRPQL